MRIQVGDFVEWWTLPHSRGLVSKIDERTMTVIWQDVNHPVTYEMDEVTDALLLAWVGSGPRLI